VVKRDRYRLSTDTESSSRPPTPAGTGCQSDLKGETSTIYVCRNSSTFKKSVAGSRRGRGPWHLDLYRRLPGPERGIRDLAPAPAIHGGWNRCRPILIDLPNPFGGSRR
jgi:hypothetical protein